MAHTVIWMKATRVKKATGTHWVITVKPIQEPSCEQGVHTHTNSADKLFNAPLLTINKASVIKRRQEEIDLGGQRETEG